MTGISIESCLIHLLPLLTVNNVHNFGIPEFFFNTCVAMKFIDDDDDDDVKKLKQLILYMTQTIAK